MTMPSVVGSPLVSATSSNSTTTQTATGTVGTAANSKLYAFVMVNVADTIDSVQSDLSENFTLILNELCTESSTNLRLVVYELLNPTAGTRTYTATRSTASASSRFLMIVVQVQDAEQALSLGSAGSVPVTDAATFTDSITTTVANCLVLGVCANGGASSGATATLTPGGSQTTLSFLNPGSTVAGLAVTSQPATTATSYTNSFTYDVTQRRAALFSVAVKPVPAGGGGGSTPWRLMLLGVG